MTRPNGEYDDMWQRWRAELARDTEIARLLGELPPRAAADKPPSGQPNEQCGDNARERAAYAEQIANRVSSEWMTRTTVGLLCVVSAGVAVLAFYTPAQVEPPPISEQARNKALTNIWFLQNLGACASDLRSEAEKVRQKDSLGYGIEAYAQAIRLAEAHHIPCILTTQGYTMIDSDNKLVTIHRDDLLPTNT